MLLIIFYGEFCSFHKPVMPRLKSQLNHEEFKLKSELQIKNWKKKKCREEASNPGNFVRVAKFRRAANLATPVVHFFLSLPNLSLCNSDSLLIFW